MNRAARTIPEHRVKKQAERGSPDSPYEHTLAERVALVRCILTCANFGVLWLGHTISSRPFGSPLLGAPVVALVFLFYAAAAWIGLKSRRLPLKLYVLASPAADIILASLLILNTNGYLSPFQTWIVFALVATGLSPYPTLPIAVTLLGIGAHSVIALVPQAQPLDLAVFSVRTGFLFAVAAIVASLGSNLGRHAREMAILADAGRDLGFAMQESDATGVLLSNLSKVLAPCSAVLELGGRQIQAGERADAARVRYEKSFPVMSAGEHIGSLLVKHGSALARSEENFVRALCERFGATMARIRLADELVGAAAREERLRLADEMHDTYLQTLAALDMRAEAARRLANAPDSDVTAELLEIKKIARQAATEARRVFSMAPAENPSGPEAALRVFAERWAGERSAQVDPAVELSESQWAVVEMLLKEGLNNAAKHGRATRVSLSISQSDGVVRCALGDDGKGFDGEPRPGYGLRRLQEAADAAGGTLEVSRAAEGGACICVEFEEV